MTYLINSGKFNQMCENVIALLLMYQTIHAVVFTFEWLSMSMSSGSAS